MGTAAVQPFRTILRGTQGGERKLSNAVSIISGNDHLNLRENLRIPNFLGFELFPGLVIHHGLNNTVNGVRHSLGRQIEIV